MTTHINPIVAFDRAIHEKILSPFETADNYAGAYMYMHSDDKGDHFKHIDTRHYVLSPVAPSRRQH